MANPDYIFQPRPEPSDHELAIRKPDGGWHGYQLDIRNEQQHWQGVMKDAFDHGQTGRYDFARSMHHPFDLAVRYMRLGEEKLAENVRHMGLGELAVSRLMRTVIREEEGAEILDPVATDFQVNTFIERKLGATNLVESLTVYFKADSVPEDLFPPDAPDGWYEKDGLLVHRTFPAWSASLETFATANQDDFGQAIGLQPFLPSQM